MNDLEVTLKVCRHVLTSSTQLQNRSFHGVNMTRTAAKCTKMKNARAKRAKLLFSWSNLRICDILVCCSSGNRLSSLT